VINELSNLCLVFVCAAFAGVEHEPDVFRLVALFQPVPDQCVHLVPNAPGKSLHSFGIEMLPDQSVDVPAQGLADVPFNASGEFYTFDRVARVDILARLRRRWLREEGYYSGGQEQTKQLHRNVWIARRVPRPKRMKPET